MPLARDIQTFISGYGNNWNPAINSDFEAFFESCHAALPDPDEPRYRENRVKYGEHERHRLDIYCPLDHQGDAQLPVVVYFHGGAFRAGDNDITPHMHANIAKFFASSNMIGILGTYRLLPEARFPDGREDIVSALKWIKGNIGCYHGDKESIFAIGQSAGGAHVGMALFSGRLREEGAMPRGILLQSAALWYDLSLDRRRESMEEYCGTNDTDKIQAHSALGMFEGKVNEDTPLPELFVTVGEWDFEECVKGNMKFLEAFESKMNRRPRFEVLTGHNHISYCLSIGLQGDEVGPRIVSWVGRCLRQ